MDYPQPFLGYWCVFFPDSQPGLGCGASPVARGASQLGQEVQELPWCRVPVAELSQAVFSRELACAAAQEILVAPLLRSLLFGARAGFGLAHILQSLAVLKGCGGVAGAAGGAQSSKLVLSRVHAVCAQTRPSGFSWETSG